MLNTVNKKTNGIKAYKEWPCVTLIIKAYKEWPCVTPIQRFNGRLLKI